MDKRQADRAIAVALDKVVDAIDLAEGHSGADMRVNMRVITRSDGTLALSMHIWNLSTTKMLQANQLLLDLNEWLEIYSVEALGMGERMDFKLWQDDKVKKAIKDGADVSQCLMGQSALLSACRGGNLKVVKHILKVGGEGLLHSSMPNGVTPLFAACQDGHLPIIKFLAKNGARLTAPEGTFASPFFISTQNGHKKVAKWLVKNGARGEIRFCLTDQVTPFWIACMTGNLEIAKWLMALGMKDELLHTDAHGTSPLLASAMTGQLESVKYLQRLSPGLVRLANSRGTTPMAGAAAGGFAGVMRFLYEHGAAFDVDSKDIDGVTPMTAAVKAGHKHVEALLERWGVSRPGQGSGIWDPEDASGGNLSNPMNTHKNRGSPSSPSKITNENNCIICQLKVMEDSQYRCGECQSLYCSRQCQYVDWTYHNHQVICAQRGEANLHKMMHDAIEAENEKSEEKTSNHRSSAIDLSIDADTHLGADR